jgi:hypothetical protein
MWHGRKELPKIVPTHSKIWLMVGKSCLNHWGIEEEVTLQNIDNIKNIITSKFKEKLWCNK